MKKLTSHNISKLGLKFRSRPPTAKAMERPTWDLEVQTLTNAVTLSVSASMTCEELRQVISEQLGVDPQHQVWHANGKRVKFEDSQSLEVLEGASQMTVLHCEPLKPLPKRFELRLTSSRERFKTGYSSAFVIQYRLRADLELGEMVFEPWRKNDHDTTVYNSKDRNKRAVYFKRMFQCMHLE